MPTRKNGETPDGVQKGWLNLSLRPYLGESRSNSSRSSTSSAVKVYTCSFCKRKFYSSQALGGHQNAHRRERDAVRRYNLPKSTTNDFITLNQSLNVHSSLVRRSPGTDNGEITTVATFTDHEGTWGQQPYAEKELNLKWPGSFYLNSQQAVSIQSDPHKLDLNLKL